MTLAPETKRQKISFVLPPSEHMDHTFLTVHQRQHIININEPSEIPPDDMAPGASSTTSTLDSIFHMKSPGWHADLYNGCIFRVDSSTDNIEEHEVYDIWPQVDEADGKEVGQFVDENAFKPVLRSSLGKDCAVIDAIWVGSGRRRLQDAWSRAGYVFEAVTIPGSTNSVADPQQRQDFHKD